MNPLKQRSLIFKDERVYDGVPRPQAGDIQFRNVIAIDISGIDADIGTSIGFGGHGFFN